jgi:hypothetical protein
MISLPVQLFCLKENNEIHASLVLQHAIQILKPNVCVLDVGTGISVRSNFFTAVFYFTLSFMESV